MLIHVKLSGLRRTKVHEYLTGFLLGGVACLATGWIAHKFGPVIGGLFLAFPAIFTASATLVEHHEREKKARAGITHTVRGRLSAALDARGASMGALALLTFAVLVWKALPKYSTAAVLLGALVYGPWWRLRFGAYAGCIHAIRRGADSPTFGRPPASTTHDAVVKASQAHAASS